jgi:oligoribonuclease NrnB/cAMP/cGMP phosphodiesterase (DHH superfamily)
MDGSAAAILFAAAGGRKENIQFVSPDRVDETIADSKAAKDPNKQILLVDVAPGSDDTVLYLKDRGNAVVIDHHASAKRWKGQPGFFIDADNCACGCENFRQWLVKNGMSKFDAPTWRRFTEIIDDHDRWILKEPMSLQMPQLFSMVGQQEFVERFSDVEQRFQGHKQFYWTATEAEMLKLIKAHQDRRWLRAIDSVLTKPVEFEGKTYTMGYIISGEINNSEFLHLILDKRPDLDCITQINFDLNKVSLRSNERLDITRFVKQFGGGGHRNAGGHPIPDGMSRQIIEATHGKAD